MKCEACNGKGESANAGQACFLCDGTGAKCDVCGEAVEEAGADVCNDCANEANA